MKNDVITKVLLIAILILALVLRVYKLDSVPPAISWDEADVGYNALAIANYGRDEYGKFFPLFFRSFGDDKHPVHIYATAISTKILGLNEFSTRLPSALFGVFNVLLIYILSKILFKEDLIALSAALFLTISPYNLHFSRFNHEANFAFFFFLLGLILFYLSLKKRKMMLPISMLSFSICFLTYHPAKVVVPVTLFILAILYFKKIILNIKGIMISFLILILLMLIMIANPQLFGMARVNQTTLDKIEVKKTKLFQLTHNEFLGKINLVFIQYSWHFSPQYLFISGDKNARLSSHSGEFYKIDALFLILGLVYLLYKRSKGGFMLLVWGIVAPLPSSLVEEAPHAARAMFMMGSWHLISALGWYSILTISRKIFFRWIIIFATIIALGFSLFNYLNYYFGEYAKRYAIDWQYGMKQIVEFVRQHEEYNQVFVTDIRSQPYIFFLYYLKTPLPDYLQSVIYNNNLDNKSYNNVASFGRFSFGGWDPVESLPYRGALYVLSPSQYDGLRHKGEFDIKRKIDYPNGTVAFYLTGAKQ